MATLENYRYDRMQVDYNDESLEHLISIWPISSKIATHLPAGDLISLSRSSRTLRSHTHGFGNDHATSDLRIGEHQTTYWANLKTLSPFICSFPSHKEPKSAKSNPCRACKFCSRPICKICIVRSFFTDPKSSKSTFKYRARHLCRKCWDTGNLRKDFRYTADCVSREQIWKGRGYAQRGNWCGCSASDDNWVCGECRVLQNTSGVSNDAVSVVPVDGSKRVQESAASTGELLTVQCYGLDCDVLINEVDRDRRRICLWCSKPVMRPYGGDDRLRWEEKQIEIRAAAAANRSADIYEWARNRFKSLTMSRREMRGTDSCIELTGSDGPEHDQPIFVRHLDTINYRQYMNQSAAPSGDNVYKSKHGRWIYSRPFLTRFNQAIERSRHARAFSLPSTLNLEELFLLNADMGLPGARTNSHAHFRGGVMNACNTILRYGVQLQNASLLDQDHLTWLRKTSHKSVTAMEDLRDRLFMYLRMWENLDEEYQVKWTPPSFSRLAREAGLLEARKIKNQKDDKNKNKQIATDNEEDKPPGCNDDNGQDHESDEDDEIDDTQSKSSYAIGDHEGDHNLGMTDVTTDLTHEFLKDSDKKTIEFIPTDGPTPYLYRDIHPTLSETWATNGMMSPESEEHIDSTGSDINGVTVADAHNESRMEVVTDSPPADGPTRDVKDDNRRGPNEGSSKQT